MSFYDREKSPDSSHQPITSAQQGRGNLRFAGDVGIPTNGFLEIHF
ncbi:hypothetical protein QMM98_07160 [Leptospira santarosai]|nr:hypothetical protein [Leptospira santarosai]MDI7221142.1 hypothetical protein [Leptospira santarosai]